MGLMDKVKAQATQIAEKAQEAGQAGQAKLADFQAKRSADALLLELGGIVYTQKAGRAAPGADARITELVGQVQAFEAEHGAVDVTVADAAPVDPATAAGGVPTSSVPQNAIALSRVKPPIQGAQRRKKSCSCGVRRL